MVFFLLIYSSPVRSYIQHLRLISYTFGKMQNRVKHTKIKNLEQDHRATPLKFGCLEDKWDDFLKAEEDLYRRIKDAREVNQEVRGGGLKFTCH